jgi:hypothetical protein
MEILETEEDGILHLQVQNQKPRPSSNFVILMYVLGLVILLWILTLSCATCKPTSPLP